MQDDQRHATSRSVVWSNLDAAAAMPRGEQLFDASMLKGMLSVVLDNALVASQRRVYRQVKGMPMGVNCAPQLSKLVLWLLRALLTWCALRHDI